MSPQILIPPKKKSKMSRLKRKPGETLQEWVNRVSKRKPYQLQDIDILALSIIGVAVLCVLIIQIVWS